MANNDDRRIIGCLKDWLPPAVIRLVRQVRGSGIRFEGAYFTWEEASAHCTGYDAEGILDQVLAATLKVKQGEAVFERDSVLFDKIEYAWPVLAGLLWVAARNGGVLNVLDFGGALGSSYFQNRKFLKTLLDVRWNVVEQVHYADAGRAHIEDEVLRFYGSIEECLVDNTPNVILLSSVLQYFPHPYGLLEELLAVNSDVIILDRTCYLNQGQQELLKVQHVPDSIYVSSYPCHFFVEKKIRDFIASRGYGVHEVFDSIDKLDPIATWKGHIFKRQIHGS
jgi:putative methyltransferase (TIGR04325 family)